MPFTGYRITSPFGWRSSPFGGYREFHTGIDLVKAHKSPIYAFTEGEVVYAGLGHTGTGLGGYGRVVFIKDKNGRGQLYAHLDATAVRTGDKVTKGQTIGYQGNTGRSTGSHLHYEVRKAISPSYGWIADRPNNCLEPIAYLESYYQPKVLSATAYKVQKGDTLSEIAKRFNTTVAKLQADNNIKNASLINIGQVLNIGGSAAVQSVQGKSTVHLPASAKTWRTYKLNVQPVAKNSDWSLTPSAFGGLTYEILGSPYPDVVTINTSKGKRNIYVGKGTGAVIK